MHQIKVGSVTISMKTNCSHVSKYRSLCSVTLSQITARLPSQSVISGLPGVCVALAIGTQACHLLSGGNNWYEIALWTAER